MITLTPSRRNVMRALAALSTGLPTLAYAAPGLVCLPSDNRSAWDAAVAAYRAAHQAELAHPYANTRYSDPDFPRIEAEHDTILQRLCRSIKAVMKCPVPDHAALVEKIEIMVAEFEPEGFTDCIIADVRRLGGEARL